MLNFRITPYLYSCFMIHLGFVDLLGRIANVVHSFRYVVFDIIDYFTLKTRCDWRKIGKRRK
jgi:hypothetical protein